MISCGRLWWTWDILYTWLTCWPNYTRHRCGQRSDRGRLKEQNRIADRRWRGDLTETYRTIIERDQIRLITSSLWAKLGLWVKCGTAKCGMRKVKCGMETAERWWLVHRSDHVTAAIMQFTACRAWPTLHRCITGNRQAPSAARFRCQFHKCRP